MLKTMKNQKNNSLIPSELKFPIYFAVLAAFLIIGFYIWNFPNQLSEKQDVWGQFGDYIGGTLNPLFSLAALFAVLHTINIQNKQISSANEAVEIQRFENHFFQMLNLFNGVKQEMLIIITYKNGKEVDERYKGIECMTKLSNQMFMSFTRLEQNKANIRASCKSFYESHRYFLLHYFRTLYSFIKFVDDSNIKNKEFYSNIVCVNLSDSEVNLLFYYCYFLDIDENKELLQLVEKYDLLKYFTDPKKHRKLLLSGKFD